MSVSHSTVTDPARTTRADRLGHAPTSPPSMPSLSALRNSAVEDPVNVWIHRPIAYAITSLLFRSRISPNVVTFCAMTVGLLAGICLGLGTLHATSLWISMSGVLLWSSAILDGVDGMLARARREQSVGGRALDGTADAVVAVATVIPAVYHLIEVHGLPLRVAVFVAPVLIGVTVAHLSLSDFYKELYLKASRDKKEHPQGATKRPESALLTWVSRHMLLPYLRTQRALVRLTNPDAMQRVEPGLYREKNRGPMRLWALLSLAPHSYLMALSLVLGRLDLYFYLRLLVFPALLVLTLIWQHIATRTCQQHRLDERAERVY